MGVLKLGRGWGREGLGMVWGWEGFSQAPGHVRLRGDTQFGLEQARAWAVLELGQG